MANEIQHNRHERGLNRLLLKSITEKVGPNAAYFYIPVNENMDVQRAQYDVLSGMEGASLEPQDEDLLHITLMYVERLAEKDIEEFFARLNVILPTQFQVQATNTGTFPEAEDKPVVIHINAHPALVRLQWELYNVVVSMKMPVSNFSDPKRYKPHITLAHNLEPEDFPIPKLDAPFTIPIQSFVASREGYNTIYTVTLPTFQKDRIMVEAGGEGSGHFEHEGRPDEVGGSLPGKGSGAKKPSTNGKGETKFDSISPTVGEQGSDEAQAVGGALQTYKQINEGMDLDSLPRKEGKPDQITTEARQELMNAEINRIIEAINSGQLAKLYNFEEDDFAPHPFSAFMQGIGTDDHDDPRVQEYMDSVEYEVDNSIYRARKDTWSTSIAQALALGTITSEQADERGWYSGGSKEYVPLPADLYHVTTGLSSVLEDRLRSRKELSMSRGVGLGGGDDETISFTADPAIASAIYHAVIEAQQVAQGERTIGNLVQDAADGVGAEQPFLEFFMSKWDKEWKEGDEIPQGIMNLNKGVTTEWFGLGATLPDFQARQEEKKHREEDSQAEWRISDQAHLREAGDGQTIATHFERDMTPQEIIDETFQTWKWFSMSRENAGGQIDPLFFMTDVSALAEVDPSEIAILRTDGRGYGYEVSALGEWRTTSGLAVEVVGSVEPGEVARGENNIARWELEAQGEPEVVRHRIDDDGMDAVQYGSTIGTSGPGVDYNRERFFDMMMEHPEYWPSGMRIDVSAGRRSEEYVVIDGGFLYPRIADKPISIQTFFDLLPTDADVYISYDDFKGGVPKIQPKDDSFAVTRSGLMALIRGESMIVGPMRRVVTLADGPFVVYEDADEPREQILPPVPLEFRTRVKAEPEPVTTYTFPDLVPFITTNAKALKDEVIQLVPTGQNITGLRDKIADVLRNFTEGFMRIAGIQTPDEVVERHHGPGDHPSGSPQEAHAGNGGGHLSARADEFEGYLFHGTLRKHLKDISDIGLVPNIGPVVEQAYGEYAGEEYNHPTTGESMLQEFTYFTGPRSGEFQYSDETALAKAVGYVRLAIAYDKYDGQWSKVTSEDIRDHGLLIGVDVEELEAGDFYMRGENEDFYEVSRDWYEDKVFYEPTYIVAQTGPEPGDYFTEDDIEPTQMIYGDELVRLDDYIQGEIMALGPAAQMLLPFEMRAWWVEKSLEVRGPLRRITTKHYGPGDHPSGSPQTAHAGNGAIGGTRRIGLTSARPGIPGSRVFKDMHEFEKELKKIQGLKNIVVKPGLGGWEGGSEPTWIVEFTGNGEADKLIAQTAKEHNQDGVLVMNPCKTPADCSPLVDYSFNERMSPTDRAKVQSILVDHGIGGWTWYKLEGAPTLRSAHVPDWDDRSSDEYLKVTETLRDAFDSSGFFHGYDTSLVDVSVMNKEGDNSYDQIIGS